MLPIPRRDASYLKDCQEWGRCHRTLVDWDTVQERLGEALAKPEGAQSLIVVNEWMVPPDAVLKRADLVMFFADTLDSYLFNAKVHQVRNTSFCLPR
jgi:hypothetical protein